ncbi:MAG: hypothetical protein JSR77_11360 [Planctomycetes bacterium]|nr:hypothetical protein [Planctomycetota bacterium]
MVYYRFEEPNGPVALDSSGHDRVGTYVGGVTLNNPGIEGGSSRAACFNGSNSYVDISNAVFAQSRAAITVEAWVNLTQPTSDFAAIVSSRVSGQLFHFQLFSAGNITVYTNTGTILLPIIPQWSDGIWHHVALVASSGSTRLFVDGTQFGATFTNTFSSITPSSGALSIARGFQDRRFLRGCIDEVAVYDRALSPDRIASHYSAGIRGLEITSQPRPVNVCATADAAFAVTAAGVGSLSYQWQVADGTLGWRNLEDGPLVLGGTPTCATITGSRETTMVAAIACAGGPGELDGRQFRCAISNACGNVYSTAATLMICACLDCPADFNQDGGIDGVDVSAFFDRWQIGHCDTDVNSDGGVDGADVSSFFAVWEAGGCG